MEKISDFFKELKERLSNPFIYSFLISWLIFNWKIPIALIFYKSEDLLKDNYKSFISLIADQIHLQKSFVYPILAALLYTFAFPFFRNTIIAFNSWTKAWGSSWSMRLSKSGKISIEKYIELRNTYAKRTQLLERTLENESKFLQENEELKNRILQLTQEKNEYQANNQKWIDYSSYSILNGEWNFQTVDSSQKVRHEKIFLIKDGTVSEIFNSSRDKKVIGRIENFHYNFLSQEMIFYINSKYLKSIDYESHFYTLRSQSGSNTFQFLQGEEDKSTFVNFTKVD
ncbi:hypothetical protein GALL_177900 [mine drainage metagenome]|uniref:Uncharacterized protein n=1 Tax=mine drainage metagenome TaxID=410659 RepID=A0A1J5S7U5_9ZZZZ